MSRSVWHTPCSSGRAKGIYVCGVQILATFASLFKFHKTDYVYPNERINDCWEKVLLNQCEFQGHKDGNSY